ncbi:MAG: NEW3 domain-containing protein [Phycisphaerae bacterium]
MRLGGLIALVIGLSAAWAWGELAPEEEIHNPLGLTQAQREMLLQVFRRHVFAEPAAAPDPGAPGLGVRLEPTVPGGFYRLDTDLPPRLRVTVRSPGSLEPVRLEYRAEDFYGRKVAEGTLVSAVPDAAGTATANLVLNELKRFGYYHVVVTATAGDRKAGAASGIVLVQPADETPQPKSPFGLVAPEGVASGDLAEVCRRLGARFLAFDWTGDPLALDAVREASLLPVVIAPVPHKWAMIPVDMMAQHVETAPDWQIGREVDFGPALPAESPEVYRRLISSTLEIVRRREVPVRLWVGASPHVLADVLTEGPVLAGADGVSLVLDAGARAPNLRSGAYRRSLDYARQVAKRMGVGRVAVGATGDDPAAATPQQQAWKLVTRHMIAVAEGAERVFVSSGEGVPTPTASAAAYAWMTHLLAGGKYEGNLWRDVPLLEAHLFSTPEREVAVVWSWIGPNPAEPEQGTLVFEEGTRLEAWDVVGRPVGIWKGPRFVVPLGEAPVYITSKYPQTGFLRDRLRRADVVGLEPATVWIESVARGSLPGRVRVWVWVQSQRPYRADGMVGLLVPAGWRSRKAKYGFALDPGEAKEFTFECDVSEEAGAGPYTLEVAATMDDTWVRRTQYVQWAQTPERTVTVGDGLLNWDGIRPVRVESESSGTFADVWTAWDRQNFYFAAAVHRRRAGYRGGANAFDRDAIQLGWGTGTRADDDFGHRGVGKALPAGAFRDTDHLVALAFGREGARVVRLRRPGVALRAHLAENMDPWYGPVEGARVVIGRDEEAGVTIYEAAIPMKELAPLRGGRDRLYRFAFRIGDGSNPPLDWAREAGVPDYLANPASFLPVSEASLPCQTYWMMVGPRPNPSAK